MAYQNNIPQASDTISKSQQDLLNNFAAIQTLIEVNHGTFGASDEGMHKFLTFPVQSAAPTFALTQNGMYSKIPASPLPQTGIEEIFVHKQSNAGVKEIPFTASTLSTATPAALTEGWSYLPSGLIIKWGANVNGTGSAVISFPTGSNIPAFTTCLNVQLTVAEGGVTDVNKAIRLTAVNPTNFTIYASPRTSTGTANVVFSYLAIGY